MRIYITLLIISHALINAHCQTPKPSLLISHLTGDFYVYTTYRLLNGIPYPANSMYLVTSGGVVLFDTPWDSSQFQPLLDSIKSKHDKDVVLCISTHFHADRTAGLEFYRRKGIMTFTTKQTDDSCKSRNEKRAGFLMYKDTSFTVGQHRFQTFFAGAGHSPDNIVIWFDREKVLYGGCLVKSVEAEDLGNLSDANVKAWTTTIKNVQQKFKNPKYIIPGHLAWNSTSSLTHTLDLIQQYEGKK